MGHDVYIDNIINDNKYVIYLNTEFNLVVFS